LPTRRYPRYNTANINRYDGPEDGTLANVSGKSGGMAEITSMLRAASASA
jgi:hypothetical protein